MTSATDELLRLLDERGVSCQTNYLHASWYVGPKLYDAVDNFDGTLTVDNLTPKQAIAATLGSGTCPFARPTDLTDGCAALERITELEATHGTLSARAERTCECIAEYAKSPIDGKTIVLHRCSACHELMRPHMAYCPSCGAKVVDE